jgi:hypothetical protein
VRDGAGYNLRSGLPMYRKTFDRLYIIGLATGQVLIYLQNSDPLV